MRSLALPRAQPGGVRLEPAGLTAAPPVMAPGAPTVVLARGGAPRQQPPPGLVLVPVPQGQMPP